MITGVDETGDFDPSSKQFNFFVGVHIDQNLNKVEIKRSQFYVWESSIPEKYKLVGEIKGQNIPDEYLVTFFNQVLGIKPTVLYSVIRIIPFENSIEILNKHKAHEVAEFEKVIQQANTVGHTKCVEKYKQILYWYKNRNYQTILKMKCLMDLLGMSLNEVMGWAQLSYIIDNSDIKNIRDISFKIDKDFIKAENVKLLWNEIFRQFSRRFNEKYPLPIMTGWKEENHPVSKFYKRKGGKTADV